MSVMDDKTITSIEPSKKDELKRVVKVGGRKVAMLDVEQVVELGLRVGDVWDGTLADRAAQTLAWTKARRAAMRMIERRALATGEVVDRLTRKGHDADVAEAVVADLERIGYLDDERYARALIDTQRASKPAGRRLLSQKLMQKRVPRDVAERVLSEADEEYDAVAEARALAEKKLASSSMARADAATRYRRIYGLLARRGFNPDTIRNAMAGLAALRDDDTRF
ncbi:MAG: hypothetical protein GC159_04635 [Phycisphaera sp.]|nr:hypothetical protein [Phycisphaera sp.]